MLDDLYYLSDVEDQFIWRVTWSLLFYLQGSLGSKSKAQSQELFSRLVDSLTRIIDPSYGTAVWINCTYTSSCLIFITVLLWGSFQFSRSVLSESLRLHGLQDASPPCPSPISRACSNSCASSRRCHPTISSSVVPFSSRLQSFPTSGFFPMSRFFSSGGQSVGACGVRGVNV